MSTFTWTGDGGGALWSNAGNWTPLGGPPGALDDAIIAIAATIDAGPTGVTVANASFSDDNIVTAVSDTLIGTLQTTIGLFALGDIATKSTYTLTVNKGGVLQASDPDAPTAAVTIDNYGAINIDDAVFNETQGGVDVGYQDDGLLTVDDGGVATFANTGNAALTLGDDKLHGDGTVDVTGAGSSLTINGSGVDDGYSGHGLLEVDDGGLVAVDDGIDLGYNTAADGQVAVGDNAQFKVNSGAFVIGVAGRGQVRIDDYTGAVDDQSSVGVDLASGVGSSGDLSDSGNLIVKDELTVGDAGLGTMEVEGSGTASLGALDIAAQSTSGDTASVSPSAVTVMASTGQPLLAALAVTNAITVGDGGYGAMLIEEGGGVSGGSLDVAAQKTSGVYGAKHSPSSSNTGDYSYVSISNSFLTIAGAATVGDAGYGAALVTGGAMTVGSLDIAAEKSSGDAAADDPSFVEVDDADSTLVVDNDAIVGDGGYGALRDYSGAATIAGNLDVAAQATSGSLADEAPDYVYVDGSGSEVTVDGAATIGGAGYGAMVIENSGAVSAASLDVAAQITSGAYGATHSPSSGVTGNPSYVYISSGGSLTIADQATVGGAGYGEVNISSGAMTVGSLDIAAEQSSGDVGALDYSFVEVDDADAALTVDNDADVGDAGYGVLIDLNGATTTIGGNLFVAAQSTSGSVADDAAAYVDVDGSGSAVSVNGFATIGESGDGALYVTDGANFTADGSTVSVGSLTGSAGAVYVANAGSTLDATNVVVGDDGYGDIAVEDSGAVSAASLDVAAELSSGAYSSKSGVIGAPSYVYISSAGSLKVAGAATVGDAGYGDANISDGGAMTVGSLDIAAQQSSGDTAVLDYSFVGVDDGALVVENDATVGNAGYGALIDRNGATTTIGGNLFIGSQTTSGSVAEDASDYVDADGSGSQITVTGSAAVGEAGAGVLDVAGGANFTANGPTMEIAAEAGSTGAVTVEDAGSTLDAETLVIGGAPTLAGGAGGLTASAGGTVDVKSALMWNGTISVDNQSLVSIGAGAATVLAGLDVQAGANLTGYGSIAGAIENDGEITASSGVLKLDGAVSGGGDERIDAGATLAFSDNAATSQTIGFGAGGGSNWGTLDLSGEGTGLTFVASISGYAGASGTASTSDVIEVAGSGGTDHVAWTQNTGSQGTLQVENASDSVLETLTLDGSYNQNQFVVTDPAAVDQITYTACYGRGTRILTDRGEVAVEALRVGDLAVIVSGALRPVVWLGHRRIDLSRHRDPVAVRPVRVSANAFGEGLPRRDLWLSPGHSLASEGALMPISCLINGRSVAQIEQDAIEYWHVELDAHDILLAEGLPAESYLDCGNRTAFANGGAFVEAHPDFQPRRWAETCLPLMSEGPAVARTKARLLARLAETGHAVDHEADAHILVDRVRIEPIRLSEWRLAFMLPRGGHEITLRSNVFIPVHTVPESADSRELGLCVGRLEVDNSPVALDSDESCASGWREAECADGRFIHRWTTGATPLAAGARIVVVDLAGVGYYWRRSERRSVALSA